MSRRRRSRDGRLPDLPLEFGNLRRDAEQGDVSPHAVGQMPGQAGFLNGPVTGPRIDPDDPDRRIPDPAEHIQHAVPDTVAAERTDRTHVAVLEGIEMVGGVRRFAGARIPRRESILRPGQILPPLAQPGNGRPVFARPRHAADVHRIAAVPRAEQERKYADAGRHAAE